MKKLNSRALDKIFFPFRQTMFQIDFRAITLKTEKNMEDMGEMT